ncbi:unnamed protein product [Blepharisma stoltei]|uniref:Uncharacterized protein n=1 Tax=Blepharisma stoltei TaxID=1481888 RepID=A0AAU9IZS3_9CILI|nr:unnamed protein product [Blepharisma stoltei]
MNNKLDEKLTQELEKESEKSNLSDKNEINILSSKKHIKTDISAWNDEFQHTKIPKTLFGKRKSHKTSFSVESNTFDMMDLGPKKSPEKPKNNGFLRGLKFDPGFEAIRDFLQDKEFDKTKDTIDTNGKTHTSTFDYPSNCYFNTTDSNDHFHDKILCDKQMICKILKRAKSGLKGISRILPSCKITTEETLNWFKIRRNNSSKSRPIHSRESSITQSPSRNTKKPYYITTKSIPKAHHIRSKSTERSLDTLIMSGMSIKNYL